MNTHTIAKYLQFSLVKSWEFFRKQILFLKPVSFLKYYAASNYYEYGSNNGAYAKITSKLKPIIVQFHVKEGDEATKNLSLRERVNVIELSAIKQLLEKFVVNKQKLMDEYKLKDTENTGAICLTDWVAITSQVLDLKLPWRSLRYVQTSLASYFRWFSEYISQAKTGKAKRWWFSRLWECLWRNLHIENGKNHCKINYFFKEPFLFLFSSIYQSLRIM